MADLPHITRKINLNGDSTPSAAPLQNPVADDQAPLPEPDDEDIPDVPNPANAPSRWEWQSKGPDALLNAAPTFSFIGNLIHVIAVHGPGYIGFESNQASAQ